CREYDYIARMGGDEFVIGAPGLSASAAEARGPSLNELARLAGRAVCGEDWLSLPVGFAIYPLDCVGVEKLLAEAGPPVGVEEDKGLKLLNQFAGHPGAIVCGKLVS